MSLRANFAATLAGNVAFAASQWLILSLLAKLGDSVMLGQYALALAVVTPIAMFSHLNLRSVLVGDVERHHTFGNYFAVRVATTLLGLGAAAAAALVFGYVRPVPAAIGLLSVALGADQFSDIYYGLMQRRERMDQIARSMAARGLLSATALGIALWLTHSLVAALAALAAGRLIVLFLHDYPVSQARREPPGTDFDGEYAILRQALPLGLVLMLASLTVNLPRYAIGARFGAAQLGAFAAVASFLTVGSTAANALGQSAMPRLARYYSANETGRFLRLTWQLMAVAGALGVSGVLVALAVGNLVLRLVYRPAYASYADLLVWMMCAGVLSYAAILLGYVITGARVYAAQAPLLMMVAATSAVGSWFLVPKFGLNGAALALAGAWLVQLAGEALILRRALARMGETG
ncbi:MAG: lipopolysaccharide biosynthesis protein [Acidobacteriales bacterium]|nr:lipopolysaccharide biosynthesis protein [Terriglobales bacterium]